MTKKEKSKIFEFVLLIFLLDFPVQDFSEQVFEKVPHRGLFIRTEILIFYYKWYSDVR